MLKLYTIYAEPTLGMEGTSLKTFKVYLHLCGNFDSIISCA